MPAFYLNVHPINLIHHECRVYLVVQYLVMEIHLRDLMKYRHTEIELNPDTQATVCIKIQIILTTISNDSCKFLQDAENCSEVAYSKYHNLFFIRLLNLSGFFSRSR